MNYACVEHEFKTFEFYNWHHVCLTYVHQSIEDGSNVVSMELYVDGTLEQRGKKIHVMLSNCVDIFERMKGLERLLKAKESLEKNLLISCIDNFQNCPDHLVAKDSKELVTCDFCMP